MHAHLTALADSTDFGAHTLPGSTASPTEPSASATALMRPTLGLTSLPTRTPSRCSGARVVDAAPHGLSVSASTRLSVSASCLWHPREPRATGAVQRGAQFTALRRHTAPHLGVISRHLASSRVHRSLSSDAALHLVTMVNHRAANASVYASIAVLRPADRAAKTLSKGRMAVRPQLGPSGGRAVGGVSSHASL